MILKQGAPAFAFALSRAVSAIDFQITLLLDQEDIRTEIGLMKVSRALLATISQSPNAVQRDILIQTVARRLGVAPSALQSELRPLLKHQLQRETSIPAPAQLERPSNEVLLAEHLGAKPELVTLIELYLPLSFITDPLCLRFVEVLRESQREGLELMQLLAERDDQDRTLSGFAAQIMSAPPKTGSDGSHKEALQSLILGFWRQDLQRRRAEIEAQLQSPHDEQTRDDMLAQAAQLTTDLKRLQRWDAGEKVIQLYMGI